MSSDTRTQGLALRQSAIHTDDSDQRQERMRQLANVFIDMFESRSRKESETTSDLAEAA
jgi:hypothetical protein